MDNLNNFKKESHKIISLPNKGFIYFDDKTSGEFKTIKDALLLKNNEKYFLKYDNKIINLLEQKNKQSFLDNDLLLLKSDNYYFSNLTLYDNLMFYCGSSDKNRFYSDVSKLLTVTNLEGKLNQKISSLTEDQYYLFVLVCSLIRKPKIILLDNYFKNCPTEIYPVVYKTLELFSSNGLVILEQPVADYEFNNYQPLSKHLVVQNYIDNEEIKQNQIIPTLPKFVFKYFIKSQIKSIFSFLIIFFITFFITAFLLNKIDQLQLNKNKSNYAGRTLYFHEKDKENLAHSNREKLDALNIKYTPSYQSYSNISVSIIHNINEVLVDNVSLKKIESFDPKSPYNDKEYQDLVAICSWDFLKYFQKNDEVTFMYNLNNHILPIPRLSYKIIDFYRYGHKTVYLNNKAYNALFYDDRNKKILNDLMFSFDNTNPEKFYVEIDEKLSNGEISAPIENVTHLSVYLQNKKIIKNDFSVTNKKREGQDPHILYLSKDIASRIQSKIEVDKDSVNFFHYECVNEESELPRINKQLQALGLATEFNDNKITYAINFFLPVYLLIQIIIAISYYFSHKRIINHLVTIIKNRHLNTKKRWHFIISPFLFGYSGFLIFTIITTIISVVRPNYSLDLNLGCNYAILLVYLLSVLPILITQLIMMKKLRGNNND